MGGGSQTAESITTAPKDWTKSRGDKETMKPRLPP